MVIPPMYENMLADFFIQKNTSRCLPTCEVFKFERIRNVGLLEVALDELR